MKKLLAAGLVTTALLATASGASADITFEKPSCTVQGIATFAQPLTATKGPNTYDFVSGDPAGGSERDKSVCSGTLNGVKVENQEVKVQVNGPGNLSCAQSESTAEGPGTVRFVKSGVVLPFTLSFTAVATEVDLTVKGTKGGQGEGSASFLKYAPAEAPLECEKVGDANGDGYAGLKKLGFEANFASDGILVAPAPAATGGGSGGGAGGGGSGGSSGSRGLPGTVQSNVAIRALAQKLRTALKKGLAVRLAGNVPARANLKALLDAKTAKRYGLTKGRKPVVVASGVVALTQSGQKTGYLRLTSAAKRKLRNARRLRLKLTGTILDVTQRRQKVNKTVVLR
ncbi:MAG: hypothetical protein M3141_00275 [Actinomycetota bacterium]|nr:hypothetical protein [Actinomycetota bacterium]